MIFDLHVTSYVYNPYYSNFNKDADRMANVALDQAEADGASEPFRVHETIQPQA